MDTTEGYLISPQQEHIWRLRGEDASSWLVLRLHGPLHQIEIAQALAKRHECLRARFPVPPGLTKPLQVTERDACTMRCELRNLGPELHELTLQLPAMSSDEYSLLLLAREACTLLAGGEHGGPEPVHYSQFAQLLSELLEEHPEERAYWAALIPPQGATAPFRPHLVEATPSADQAQALGQACSLLGTTPERLFLAAWLACLARSRTAAPLWVGVGSVGRPSEDLDNAVGPYARFLPLTAQLAPSRTCHELLQTLEQALEDHDARQLFYAPEQPAILAYLYSYWAEPLAWHEAPLTAEIVDFFQDSEPFELRLRVLETQAGWRLQLFQNAELYDEAEGRTLLEQLLQVAAAFAAEARLGRLPWLTSAQRQRLLVAFNHNPFPELAARQPFHAMFADWARRVPERQALVAGADTTARYGDLISRARQLTHELARRGIAAEHVVALQLAPSIDLIAAMLACSALGATFLPLELTQPAERLAAVLADSRPALVLAQAAPTAASPWPTLVLAELAPALSDPWPETEPVLERGAYLIYTSGSTGRPKGVVVSQGNLAQYVLAISATLDLQPGWSYAVVSSLATDLAGTMVYPALCTGGTLHLLDRATRTDGAAFAAYLDQHRIDCLKITPSHLAALWEPAHGAAGLPLRRLVLGGEASPRAWVDRLAAAQPGLAIHNHYGPTETTVGIATCALAAMPAKAFPIGHPLPGSLVYVVDAMLELVAPGQQGELLIGGAQVARGYLGQPAQTALRFVPDPFSGASGARLYRSGDLVHFLADGALTFARRLDRQLKIRGYRVEPGEVEAQLRLCPGVRQAAVLASTGDEPELVAFTTGDAQPEELRAQLSACLPDYMLPRRFVRLAAMPLTPNGKRDDRALLAQLPALNPSAAAAETLEQRVMLAIWRDLLGQPPVALDTPFFQAGGNSLLLIRANNRIRKLFGVELALDALFAAATVRGMAQVVAEARPAPALLARLETLLADDPNLALEQLLANAAAPETSIAPRLAGPARLSFAQSRLWFLQQAHPGSAFLNNPYAVRLRGSLDSAAFERACAALQERHEPLRTRFSLDDEAPLQWVELTPPAALTVVDLGGLTTDSLAPLLSREARRPFDLERAPLWRYRLFRQGQDEHVLALTMHHICSDGWSMRVLVRDLAALYQAELDGTPPELAKLPWQYADYAQWQRAQWDQGAWSGSLAYWRERLRDLPTTPVLPLDRPRPLRNRHLGELLPLELSATTTAGLLRLAEARGATPFMLGLAAFALLLNAWGEAEDLVIGTDLANRDREEVEGLIGFFVNQLVLRLSLAGEPTVAALLDRVQATCLEAYAHREVPFDQLVKAVGADRDSGAPPLFSVKFFLEQELAAEPAQRALAFSPVETRNPAARLDLTLGLWLHGDCLRGWFGYDTELFEAETIADMAQLFAALVERLPQQLDRPVGELTQALRAERRALIEARRGERRRANLDKVQRGARRARTVKGEELLRCRNLHPDQELLAVLESSDGPVDLPRWLAERPSHWQALLARHGALLFRGFGIDQVAALEACIERLLVSVFRENSEHRPVGADGAVQTPVAYAADRRLLWHNENTFNRHWPTRILFACAKAAATGGATPLVDGRLLYRRMPAALRDRFAREGLLYMRNYHEALGLSWQQVFRTDDRSQVEALCRAQGTRCEWRADGQLRTLARRPALGRHPETGEPAWWGQPLHWHLACLDAVTRAHFESTYAATDLPRHCFFGDGSPIADEDIATLIELHEALELHTPWQKGDLILVDNLLAAHGRQPYSGERQLLVAMGDLVDCQTLAPLGAGGD